MVIFNRNHLESNEVIGYKCYDAFRRNSVVQLSNQLWLIAEGQPCVVLNAGRLEMSKDQSLPSRSLHSSRGTYSWELIKAIECDRSSYKMVNYAPAGPKEWSTPPTFLEEAVLELGHETWPVTGLSRECSRQETEHRKAENEMAEYIQKAEAGWIWNKAIFMYSFIKQIPQNSK